MLYRVRMADEAAKEQHGGGGSRPVIGWRDLHLWQIQPVRDVLVGLAIVGLFLLGDATSVVTVPLLLAILLAYLFEPVIAWAERKTRFSRPAVVGGLIGGVVLVVVVPVVIGIAVGVTQFAGLLGSTGQRIGMVYESVRAPDDEQLAQKLAEEAGPAWSWIRDRLLESGTQEELQPILKAARERLTEGASEMLGSTASFGADAIGGVLSVVGGVFGFAFGVFLTGFFFFFVSTGWVGVKGFARNLVPDKHEAKIIDLAGKCDEVISGFVRGRLTIAFLQGAVFSVAYFLIGVPAAFIVGPVVAILSIVPYLALVGLPVSVGLLWLEGHGRARAVVVGARCAGGGLLRGPGPRRLCLDAGDPGQEHEHGHPDHPVRDARGRGPVRRVRDADRDPDRGLREDPRGGGRLARVQGLGGGAERGPAADRAIGVVRKIEREGRAGGLGFKRDSPQRHRGHRAEDGARCKAER